MRRERIPILVLALLVLTAPCLAQSGGAEHQPSSIKPPQSAPTERARKTPAPPKGESISANDLEARERQLLEALKRGDVQAFGTFLADDAVEVTAQGLHSKAQILETLKGARLLEYTMADLKTTQIDKDASLITYRTTGKFSAQGQEGSFDAQATTLWVRRNGKWLAFFHQETPVLGH